MRLALLAFFFTVAGCGQPRKIEWVAAQPGAVETQVAHEMERAEHDGRRVLVYVGATWCEPCKRFHEAVQRGALDERFGGLRLVEFDLDHDSERLATAGYAPRLIPMLAVPDAEGRASGRKMEGSVKGDGAVDHMIPQLIALLKP